MKHTVIFSKEVKIKEGKTLLDAFEEAGIKIKDDCEGKGKCGKCVVKVSEGALEAPTNKEVKRLGEEKIAKGFRLACQAVIAGDLSLNLSSTKSVKKVREDLPTEVPIVEPDSDLVESLQK